MLRRARLLQRDQPLEAADAADRTLACQISEDLGGLPLALDQAGAFIEETASTLKKYLGLYRAAGAQLRNRRGNSSTDHSAVTRTFSVSFGRVATDSPAAADLLRACAFLAPDAIPEEVFIEGAEKWGSALASALVQDYEWSEVIAEATQFGLIRRNAADKTFQMHRLVQAVLKDEMDLATRRDWAERAVRVLSFIFPTGEFEDWGRCERLFAHARSAADLVMDLARASIDSVRLMSRIGGYLTRRGRFSEAEAVYQRALVANDTLFSSDHFENAIALGNLATVYWYQRRYDAAEPVFKRALAIFKKSGTFPEDSNCGSTINNLATLYIEQRRYEEAEPLLRSALAIFEAVSGSDSRESALTLMNLGRLYCDQDRYPEAELVLKQSLAVYEKVLEPDHPDVVRTTAHLAQVYSCQGRHADAELLFRQSLILLERTLGRDHPSVHAALKVFLALYEKQSLYQAAVQVCSEYLERWDVNELTRRLELMLAWLFAEKAHMLNLSKQYRDAVAVCDEMSARFGASEIADVQFQVIWTLKQKSIALRRSEQLSESRITAEQIIQTYADASDGRIVAEVVSAGHALGDVALCEAKRYLLFGSPEEARMMLQMACKHFRAAIVREPNESFHFGCLAYAQFLLGCEQEAQHTFQQGLVRAATDWPTGTWTELEIFPLREDAQFRAQIEVWKKADRSTL